MTDWYTWPTLDTFNAWHTDAKAALGIPHPGVNQASGDVDESATWTTAYTDPVTVAADDVRAYVEPEVATLVPDGLGAPCDPPPAPPIPEEG